MISLFYVVQYIWGERNQQLHGKKSRPTPIIIDG